jgi:acyl-CoA synthetase (AMP-forming)/AMP-acid ligase II
MDSEGYFSIVDRKKEMIIPGGLNAYPQAAIVVPPAS